MFDIISKDDLWRALTQKRISDQSASLKQIQDGYVIDRLKGVRDCKILELGGGNSRVLQRFANWGNECWNADRLEGRGNGPVGDNRGDKDYRIVRTYMGEFSPELPDAYFDYIVSVSAVEHTPLEKLEAMFADCARCLKPGGLMVHTIDIYMFDWDYTGEAREASEERLFAYLSFADRPDLGIKLVDEPVLQSATFRSHYASNSDFELWRWNNATGGRIAKWRAISQNCSIKAEWRKAD